MLHSLEVVSAALFALVGASLIMLAITRWTRVPAEGLSLASYGNAVFLFQGPNLVDASPAARRLLRGQGRDGTDLAALLALLSKSFGADLGQRIAALPAAGRLLLASPGGEGTLEAQEEGGALRLTLHLDESRGSVFDRLSLEIAQEELALLRGIAEDAPQPIWALDEAGRLVWANRAYLELADLVHGVGREGPATPGAWPIAPIFAPSENPSEGRVHRQREALPLPGRERPLWYDVTTVRQSPGTLHFGADVGDLVLAESARLAFVQSLAKTFAHLSTGLAIFDRQRRLVLFNPAFVDLTGLPIDFLSGRPLVHSVLDRLREAEILPEPRDYVAWREEIAALEAAAAQGEYADTWALPGGRTYRVTGRPHPDGALAFLFEDISEEVGQTRRLRADLATACAVLDASGEAMAAFGPTNTLSLCNAAYAELWGPPAANASGSDLLGEAERWQAACVPSPLSLWDHLRNGALGMAQAEVLHLLDGRAVILRVSPLPQGARLVAFRLLAGHCGLGPDACQSVGPTPDGAAVGTVLSLMV